MTSLFLGTLGGAGVHTLTALGLGTAGGYGISRYYDNKPREDLYYQAAIAIDCIINTHSPLGFNSDQYNQIDTNLNKLIVALRKANDLLDKYRIDDLAWQGDPGYSKADAIKKINLGEKTRRDSGELISLINNAGEVLRGKVRILVINVDREILKTEPDPAAMMQILNGLGVNNLKIEPGINIHGSNQSNLKSKQRDLNFSQIDVKDTLVALDSAVTLIDDQLNKTVTAIRTKEDQDSCKPPTAKSNLIVDPEDSAITMNAGESRQFIVMGSVGIPRVGLSGDFPSNSVSYETRLVNGVVQITVEAKIEAKGSATLSIFDGSSLSTHKTQLNIIPSDNQKKVSSPPPPPPKIGRNNGISKRDEITAKNKILKVQQILKVTQTGVIDDQTRIKLKEKERENNLISDGILTNGLYDLIIRNDRLAAINDLEERDKIEKDARNGSAEIKNAREKLGLNVTKENKNKIDIELREAIWNYQSNNNLEINGILNSETYAKLIQ